jgi:hypothetical protein
MILMATNPIDNKIYTYDDYLKFPEDTVAEIIYGRISAVLPAPSRITAMKCLIYTPLMIKSKLIFMTT